MVYDQKTLRRIYDRTSGYCHICARKMYFNNYGLVGARGAWEVEHSVAQVKGGSDHLNNLYGAHISCNRKKQDATTATARSWHDRTRAPLSRTEVKRKKQNYTVAGAVSGSLLGLRFGLPGALVGSILGAVIGSEIKPKIK